MSASHICERCNIWLAHAKHILQNFDLTRTCVLTNNEERIIKYSHSVIVKCSTQCESPGRQAAIKTIRNNKDTAPDLRSICLQLNAAILPTP